MIYKVTSIQSQPDMDATIQRQLDIYTCLETLGLFTDHHPTLRMNEAATQTQNNEQPNTMFSANTNPTGVLKH